MKSLIALLLFALSSFALAVETGSKAPDFNLEGTSLSSHKGKVVVLEWLNHGCPFVKKHYGSGNMQALQKKYTGQGVVWLSIISSAEGKQGYVTKEEAAKEKTEHGSGATAVLRDVDGTVGKLYGAKTTPHMFVVDKAGNLVYQGAMDDRPDTDPESVKSAKNFVAKALDEVMAGKKVTQATTKAYGCSVKYKE